MRSIDLGFAIIFGICLGFWGGVWLFVSDWDIAHLKDILTACQKDLPRSQKCELVAAIKK